MCLRSGSKNVCNFIFHFSDLCRDEFGIGESVRVICLLCSMLISRFNAAIFITGFTGSCICRGVFVWVSYFFLLLLVCSFFGGGAKFLLFLQRIEIRGLPKVYTHDIPLVSEALK